MKIEEFIMEFLETEKTVTLWWMSDFYEDYCNFANFEFNEIYKNQRKMRYRLNKMVKNGMIEKRTYSHGYLGKTDFGAAHCGIWAIVGHYKDYQTVK